MSPAEASERRIVLALCALAAVRVSLFAIGFPFFNNVDEDSHFDLALRYAHADLPVGLVPISPETVRYVATYGTREFRVAPEQMAGGVVPRPVWTLPPDARAALIPQVIAGLGPLTNNESTSPPLYYAVAGAWLRIGTALGLDGRLLLYWLRLLDPFVVAALVWLGYVAARMVFPAQPASRLAVPLLLAFFPQDIFYSIQSDVLSPLCCGALFIVVARLLRDTTVPARSGSVAGMLIASCWLVKISNLPLIAIASVALIVRTTRLARDGKVRTATPGLLALATAAVVPIALWMIWSLHAFGDLTGSHLKIDYLGWTRKPLAAWWPHPLFTWRGASIFWSDLMASFWRGEFVWNGRRIASPLMDALYWSVSSALLLATMVGLLRRRGEGRIDLGALRLALASFFAAVLFLASISIGFDFGDSYYPSPAYPYFASGRLMTGALIPFALLMVYGLDVVLRFLRRDTALLPAMAVFVVLITVSEITLSLPAFSSPYGGLRFLSMGE